MERAGLAAGRMVPFPQLFPEEPVRECRVLVVAGHLSVPDGEYALVEAYCLDPECDCRRVAFQVMRRAGSGPEPQALATIGWGLDPEGPEAPAQIDPLHPQAPEAPALLELIQRVALSDRAYVDRLRSHYAQVKRAAAEPGSRVRAIHQQMLAGGPRVPASGRGPGGATGTSGERNRVRKNGEPHSGWNSGSS